MGNGGIGSSILVGRFGRVVIDMPMRRESSDHTDHMTSSIEVSCIGRPDDVVVLIFLLSREGMSFSTGAGLDFPGGRASY